MTWKELPDWIKAEVRGIVLGYHATKAHLRETEYQIVSLQCNRFDATAVRSGRISDPTYTAAIRLCAMHDRKEREIRQVKAVEQAAHEVFKGKCARQDVQAAIFDSFKPPSMRTCKLKYCENISISEKTFYRARDAFAIKVAEGMKLC